MRWVVPNNREWERLGIGFYGAVHEGCESWIPMLGFYWTPILPEERTAFYPKTGRDPSSIFALYSACLRDSKSGSLLVGTERHIVAQEELESKLRSIVLQHSRIKAREATAESVLTRDLGFDSMAFLLTVSDIDEEYAVELEIEKIEDLANLTFGQLCDLVQGVLKDSAQT